MEGIVPNALLNRLLDRGYEAFFVGGCVRDILLNRVVHDWDITTSALPEQVMDCFSHCIPTGIKHGTVTVSEDGFQAEITTYRTDGVYVDGRHPEQVRFVRALEEDLARRDFTINSMAMASDGTIIDLYGGQQDLQRGIIRCVGDPEVRFREDALRMLRALRFSAQLGFAIEPCTLHAIAACSFLCGGLSAERVREEVEKILLSDRPERLGDLVNYGLLERFVANCNGKDAEYSWLTTLPAERSVRWVGLYCLWPDLDLNGLRLDRKTIQNANLVSKTTRPKTRLDLKRVIADLGEDRGKIAAQIYNCLPMYEEIIQSGECLNLRHLAVRGSDFPEVHGKQVGELLHMILEDVLEHPNLNDKKIILEKYKNRIDYYY